MHVSESSSASPGQYNDHSPTVICDLGVIGVIGMFEVRRYVEDAHGDSQIVTPQSRSRAAFQCRSGNRQLHDALIAMPTTIALAEYLFTRLHQLGVQSIHGVPGDYILALLDYLEPNIHWVGNCNELNAGYAADGYARIKGLGALITTFGVGELSAANAIAGSFAEHVPVVHIVGTPTRHLQDARVLIHHTLGDGDYRRFAQMYAHITIAQANLRDPRIAPALIDSAIQQCLLHSRPVYIEVPADVVSLPVLAHGLETKITLPPSITGPDEEVALQYVLSSCYASQRPIILVDGETKAYGAVDEVQQLVTSTGWPTWTSVFGKSLINESSDNFYGVWKGSAATQSHQNLFNSSDLILCFGPHLTSTNTYNFSSVPNEVVTIFFASTSIKTPGRQFSDLPAKDFITKLLNRLDISKLHQGRKFTGTQDKLPSCTPIDSKEPVTQQQFYRAFSAYFRPGDIILAETGTAGHGCRDFKLPSSTHLLKPVTWLSIGYMLPAAQGVALAQRELSKLSKTHPTQSVKASRTILFIGDGSFQMTAQELSTIIREKLNVIVVLINNSGYTIERCIHGHDKSYNDVAGWRYLEAPAFFSATSSEQDEYPVRTSMVRTWRDLNDTMVLQSKTTIPGLTMIEVAMERLDAPVVLLTLLKEQESNQGGL